MINRFDAETWTVEGPFQVNRCHRPTQLLMPVAVSGQGSFTLGDRETVDSPESVSDDLRLLNEVQVGGPPSLTGTFVALRLTSPGLRRLSFQVCGQRVRVMSVSRRSRRWSWTPRVIWTVGGWVVLPIRRVSSPRW